MSNIKVHVIPKGVEKKILESERKGQNPFSPAGKRGFREYIQARDRIAKAMGPSKGKFNNSDRGINRRWDMVEAVYQGVKKKHKL